MHADEKMAMCLSDPLLNQTMTDYRWFIEDIFGKETDESLAVSLIRQGRVSPSPKNEPNLLHRAAEKGWNRLASLLLEAPYSFSVNEIDKDHHATALFYAAANGHYSVVKTLIAKGADSNKTSTCMHETPLFAAAKHGHTRVVCTLIDKGGANPDAGTLLMTPLTIAVGLKHQSVVECLLARHADVRLASHNGSEMPFFAATQSTADIFDLIVRHGGAEVPPLAAGGDPTIVREMILSLDNQGKVTNSKLVVINPRTRSECSIKSDYKRFPLSRSYEPAQVSNLISNGSYEELYFCKAELVGNLKGISDPGIKYRMELIIGRKSDKELLVITPWQNACLAGNYALLDRMQAPADMNQDLVRRLQRWLSNSASSGVSSALNETARKALEDTLFLYRYHGEYLKQIQAPESICKCFRSTDNAELKGLLSLCFEQFQTGTSHDKTLAPSWSHVPSFR